MPGKTKKQLESDQRIMRANEKKQLIVLGFVMDELDARIKRYEKGTPGLFESKDHAVIAANDLDLADAETQREEFLQVLTSQNIPAKKLKRGKLKILNQSVVPAQDVK